MKKILWTIIGLFFISIFVCFSSVNNVKAQEEAPAHENIGKNVQDLQEKIEEHKTNNEETIESENAEHEQNKGHGEHNAESHDEKEAPHLLTSDVDPIAKLPVFIIFLPILGALLYLILARQSYIIRNCVMVGTSSLVFILLGYLYKYIVPGVYINGILYKGIYYTLPFISNFNFTIKIDPFGYAIAMISSFIWLIAIIYGIDYMTIEKKVNRYNFFTIFSLSAQLGVLLAGDFLTLFLFFEGLVIFPYSMVAHHEDKEALFGANIFLYMSVATGLFLLMGIVLLNYITGTVEIKAMGDVINNVNPGWIKYLMIFLLIFGFGGKAGIFFEHAWLPRAHPVAPTPGSALLSGVMIKAGAYGIIRTVNLLFSPGSFSMSGWINMVNIGYVLIWVGVITMFLGILNALLSDNSKRMLAYSSISQMGYIIVAIGCAAYLGKDGAMGLAGAIYHIINHALFKAVLFMGVGAAYFRTHELNMYKLGGLWKNMPIVAIATIIAALGYGGVPLFNGFASKTLIHHAIIEAYEHSVHYSPIGKPDGWLRVAEVIFMITAGAGIVAVLKMALLTFFGKRPEKYEKVKDIQLPMKISFIVLTGVMIFIGLNPNWLIEKVVGPALAYFGLDPLSHPYHIVYNAHATGEILKSTIPILYEPIKGSFFNSSEAIHNILGASNAILIAGTIFILGFRLGWFKLPDSKWLTIEFYYLGLFKGIKKFCAGVIVEASEMVSKSEVDAFNANYEAFKKFCGETNNLELAHVSGPIPKYENNIKGKSLSVSKVSDWISEKEIKFFRRNYDAFAKFCKVSLLDTPDISPGFTDGNVARFSEWVDKKETSVFTSGYKGFTAIGRNTIGRLSYYLNRLVLFLMVDIWLATSHTRSVYKRFDDAFISWYGGELVVDKKLADNYLKLCHSASNFDYNFIDGMVNGVAWFIHTYGRGMRRIQTGYIQNYALSTVIGVVAMVILFLMVM